VTASRNKHAQSPAARRPAAAEWSLRDPPVGKSGEWRSPSLHLEQDARGVLAHQTDGILVGQIVGTLDGIEGMSLRAVVATLGMVPERGVDAALRSKRMAAKGVHAADEADVQRGTGLHRGPRSCQASADDQQVVFDHGRTPAGPLLPL